MDTRRKTRRERTEEGRISSHELSQNHEAVLNILAHGVANSDLNKVGNGVLYIYI